MSVPERPEVRAPRASEAFVCARRSVILRLSKHQDGSSGGISATHSFCSTVVTPSPSGWAPDANFFATGRGQMNQMASTPHASTLRAGGEGETTVLGWDTSNFVGSALERVTQVELRIYTASTFTTPPGTPGGAIVRLLTEFQGKLFYAAGRASGYYCQLDQAAPWSNVATNGTLHTFDITNVIRAMLGRRTITVGDLRTMGPDFRVRVTASAYGLHNVTTWYAGGLFLRVQRQVGTTASTTQSAIQFQVRDSTLTVVRHDTGKLLTTASTIYLPPETLPDGEVLFVTGWRWDGNDVQSGNADWTEMTTLPEGAARLLAEGDSEPVFVADWEILKEATSWKNFAGQHYTSSPLVRGDEPHHDFRVTGSFVEDGKVVPYVEKAIDGMAVPLKASLNADPEDIDAAGQLVAGVLYFIAYTGYDPLTGDETNFSPFGGTTFQGVGGNNVVKMDTPANSAMPGRFSQTRWYRSRANEERLRFESTAALDPQTAHLDQPVGIVADASLGDPLPLRIGVYKWDAISPAQIELNADPEDSAAGFLVAAAVYFIARTAYDPAADEETNFSPFGGRTFVGAGSDDVIKMDLVRDPSIPARFTQQRLYRSKANEEGLRFESTLALAPQDTHLDQAVGTVADGSLGALNPLRVNADGQQESSLFARTSTGNSPAGFRGMGLGVLLTLPIAQQGWRSGPDGIHPYEPIILDHLDVTNAIEDFETGHGATPSSSVSLANVNERFWTALSGGDPSVGWIAHGRRLRLYLVGRTSAGRVPWEERLPVLDALVQVPQGPVLAGGRVSLRLSSHGYALAGRKIGDDVYSPDMYPNLKDGLDGVSIPEMIGQTQTKIRADVVDTAGRRLRPCRQMNSINGALSVDAISLGTSTVGPSGGPPWWIFDSGSNHITILTPGVATFDAEVNGDWRVTGSPLIGDRQTNQQAGDLALYLLDRGDVPSADIAAGTFGPYRNLAGVFVDSETDIPAMIKHMQIVGRFRTIERPDGKFEAVDETPDGPSAATPVITDADIVGSAPIAVELDMRGIRRLWQAIARADSHAKWEEAPRSLSNYFWGSLMRYGIDSVNPPFEWHGDTSADGAQAVPDADRPKVLAPLTIQWRKGILAYAGTTFIMKLSATLDPGGYFDNYLYQVMVRKVSTSGAVELIIQQGEQLAEEDRP